MGNLSASAAASVTVPSPVTTSTSTSAPPLLGRAWDALFLGPGATLVVSTAFVLLWVVGRTTAAAGLATVLSLFFLGPHYAATYRRAYGSLDVLRAHPVVTLLVPIAVVAGAVAAVASPRFAPFYFLAYVGWSGYHYSGQSLGIAMLFPMRQGARLDAREKRLLGLPLYASWILSLIGLMRVGTDARNAAYAIVTQTFAPGSLPTWVVAALVVPMLMTFAGVAIIARERRARGVPLPAMTIAVVVTQVIWFVGGLFHPFFNIVLVPVFHSLQYLALTSWHFTRGVKSLLRFGLYIATVIFLGLLINPGSLIAFVPHEASPRALAAAAAVISAINLHHFLMDGRIWRMREKKVRQTFAT
ncbi:MAG TPA: hypothetical protein VHJ20_17210 [Polyangia bacterium]|nr:hypothetical protein [Polyangia bacterium]